MSPEKSGFWQRSPVWSETLCSYGNSSQPRLALDDAGTSASCAGEIVIATRGRLSSLIPPTLRLL